MGETDLSREIRKALARLPGFVVRLQSGKVKVRGAWMHLAPNGTPDILHVGPHGRCTWIEVKLPKAGFEDSQQPMHATLRALGHVVVTARTVQQAVDAVAWYSCPQCDIEAIALAEIHGLSLSRPVPLAPCTRGWRRLPRRSPKAQTPRVPRVGR